MLFLKNFFVSNNYSSEVFYNILKPFLNNKFKLTTSFDTVPKMEHYIKLPFYGNELCNRYTKQLNSLLSNAFPAIKFKFIFYSNYKIGSFFNSKTKLPDKCVSNICYLFRCSHCSMRYIGCSTRAFNTRIHDHLGKSFRTEQLLQSPTFSAIREHSHNNNHTFNSKDFKIIARLQHESEVFIAEQLLIDKYKPELNRQIQ